MFNTLLIFIWVWAALIALSFVEAYVEGRNAWHKHKYGWKIKIFNIYFTGYHFFLFIIMIPLFLTLPLIIYGFNIKLLGILISAYFTGLIIEDIMWYVVNPKVKLKEYWTSFSNYFPWIKIKNKKIIPVFYIINLLIVLASWYFLWK